MQMLWPLIIILGYYFAPALAVWLWLRAIWALRSGGLRAVAMAVLIITLSISLNLQIIPSYNAYWLFIVGIAVFLIPFLPIEPQARPYILATHALFLISSFALHIYYAYFYERLQFDNSFMYFALPCLSLSFCLSILFSPQPKHQWMRLLSLLLALGLGLALAQLFYSNA